MHNFNFIKFLPHVLLLTASSIFSSGCGSDTGPEKVGVNGMVTLDGDPVVQGTIAFVSLEGGRTCATPIADGAYELRPGTGPFVGPQKVTILAFEKTGQVIKVTKSLPGPPDEAPAIPPGGLELEETKQVLPARYNTTSELTATLSSGDNNFVNFDLTSAEQPAAP